MTKFKQYNYITIELYKHFSRSYNKSYNESFNPLKGTEASTSLHHLIKQRRLTDCLECLETLGYSQEQSVVVLGAVQLIEGLEVAA